MHIHVGRLKACPTQFLGAIPDAAQVELAGAELGKGFHRIKVFALGDPEARHAGFRELPIQVIRRERGVHVQGHQSLAAHVVRDAGHHALGIAEHVEDGFFHFEMWHHFAGDFAEAREAVGDAQEAFVVEQRNVAGDIPAVAEDFGGALGLIEVAQHAVGAFDQQQAFGIGRQRRESDRIHNARGDAGQRVAHGAGLVAGLGLLAGAVVGSVDGHCRGHLGAAVAFQQFHAELFAERIGGRLAQLLGAHQDVAQAGEFLGRAFANIGGAEGGSGEQQGGLVLVDEFSDGAGIGGIGVVDHAAAGEQREPDGHRETERMEKRQHAHDAVAGVDPEELGDGFDLADQVVVGEHDALGDAGGAAGEDDGGQGVRRAASARKQRGGGEARGQPGAQFGKGGGALEQVLDVDGTRQGLDLCLGEEGVRTDYGADAALFDGGLHGVRAGGEVEVYRYRAAQGKAHVHQRTGHRGGEEYAYHFGRGGAWPHPTQQHGGGQHFAVGERTAGGVGHGEFGPVAARHLDHSAVQQVARPLAERGGTGGEFLDGLAYGLRAGARRQRRAETDGHGVGNPFGPLPEKLAAGEAEYAAPQAIQVHRNDGHAAALDNLLHAAFEGPHVAGAADGALGENADDVAGGDFPARGADGFHHVARAAGAHRDGVGAAQEPVESLHLVDGLPHHEADEALHAGADQEAIHVRHVVGDQQRGSPEGHVFLAVDADAEEAVGEHPQHEADQIIRDDGDDVDRDREQRDAEAEHDGGGAEVQAGVTEPHDEARDEHADGLVEIVGGHHAALFAGVAALLDVGVERDHEEAAGHRQANHRGGGEREGVAHGHQGEREKAHERSAHGDQPEFHLIAGEAAGQHVARADADGEEGPEQGNAAVVRAQHVPAEVLQVRLEQHAGEPEVRDAEDGEPERLIVEQVAGAAGNFGEGVPAERLSGAGGRDAGDAQAGGEADGGDGERGRADAPGLRLPHREQHAAAGDAQDDGDEGAHFEPRVAAREVAVAEHLGDYAVLGGAEDGGVQSHQEDHQQHAFGPTGNQRGEPEEHDGDFEKLDADEDAALADQIGQVARVSAEQQRGQGEDGGHQRHVCRIGVAHVEGDDGLIDAVVESAQELGPEEGLEAAVLKDVAESAVCHAKMSATELPIDGRG